MLRASAGRYDITNFIQYGRKDLIETDFYKEHKRILDQPRGAGYWLWKPYYILESLSKLKEDDILIYVDSGIKFIESPQPLADICSVLPNGILLFDIKPITTGMFTKRDAFVLLDADNEQYWNYNMTSASFMVLRKTKASLGFVKEWLDCCTNERVLTDLPNSSGKENLPEFLDHRHDMSILSVLVAKYGMETFRNPSKHGNYLKMIAYRKEWEEVGFPYYIKESKGGYSENPQMNSPYGTLFLILPKDFESRIARIKHYIQILRTRNIKKFLHFFY